MKVLVVGGGTAGLISALILKKRLNISVDVVYSKNVGIIGVGEGSTEHFNEFMKFMEIDFHTIIKECDATFKSGIMFEGWSENPYLHSVGGAYSYGKLGQYPTVIAAATIDKHSCLTSPLPWDNRIPKTALNKFSEPPYFQYHFNTFKLNEFLTNLAKKMGINIFEDDIEEVSFKNDGSINSLYGKNKLYEYDFYVDCTGFKRLLIEKLGSKWISFNKFMKMKSAITFQTGDTDEYAAWTLAKAMDYGWMFRLPVWGRHGNGYIFDSDYISADEAKRELDILFGEDLEIGRTFQFDPGHLDKFWVKNCVAIGLSGLFVEPLEASSIGATIQQAFLLMHRFPNYDERVIESYNKAMNDISNNIRDFIVLHYVTNKTNSEFWKDISSIDLPDSLKNNIELWKNRMPINDDLSYGSQYSLFKADNFAFILHGLNLFNIDSIKKEFLTYDKKYQDEAYLTISAYYDEEISKETFGHKQFLSLIRG